MAEVAAAAGVQAGFTGVGDLVPESEEEREKRVRRMFSLLDQRQTGYLDHEQIEAGLGALSLPARRTYALELFDVCDSNHDGRIDLAEFRRYVDAKERELYSLFKSIDVSHDGVIEPEEMRIALSTAGIEIGDAELAAFVQHVDQDKNGIITFNEWRDFLWVYPQEVTLSNIYQYWEKVYLVDIGEGAVIPEGIGKHNTARYLLAGAVAGALSRTVTAPLDRLKVLLQVQTNSAGVIAGLWHIYKQSGFMGFFRGNGINILKVAPESAIKFYSYEMMKRIVVGDGQHGEIGTWGRLSAGGIAGAIAQTAIYPMDLVKTRLQCYSGPGRPPRLLQLSRDIVMLEGPRALYRGLIPSLLGMVPYAGIDLATYDTLKSLSRQYLAKDTEPGALVHLACGTISGAVGATCVYPLQLIRTRLQAQPLNAPDRYKGMGDVFKKTLAHEGLRGFYKGLVPNLLKVVPAASITYLVYEDMKIRLSIK
ncbi:hypothetical protein CY35_16G099400 [Sphagnum magellanicum]|nr:hypothetical protein CY35_16G099400 [Sphagnum magellanicum]